MSKSIYFNSFREGFRIFAKSLTLCSLRAHVFLLSKSEIRFRARSESVRPRLGCGGQRRERRRAGRASKGHARILRPVWWGVVETVWEVRSPGPQYVSGWETRVKTGNAENLGIS